MKNAKYAGYSDASLLAALTLLSAATTAQQIALMQVLGWMHWHHFAYMVVSIALLGFGIAGTWLSLDRDRLLRTWRAWLPWMLVGAAVAMPSGVRLAQLDAFAVDLPLVFFAPRNVWRLAALCLLLLPPFLCAGLVTGAVLTAHAERAGRYYAASLAGAGAGGLIGLSLVAGVSPPRLPVATAALALAAAGMLWAQLTLRARSAAALTAVLLAALWLAPGELASSQFKPLRRTLELPDARVIAARAGVHGWLQVVAAPALRPSPAVSFEFQGGIPPQPIVFINGVPAGSILDGAAVRAPEWVDFTTDAAAFRGAAPRRVALLENGPGGWAALSAQHGAERIAVVEPNRALTALLTENGPAFAPEWSLPAVQIVPAGGRAFLRRTRETFDLIRFPTVGALGGSAGLGSAGEQFLLTREAFVDAWRRLTPAGVIAVTAWMDFPERNSLRLIATLAEAVESMGVTPRAHIAAVRGWATVTFLVRRSSWDARAAMVLREFCRVRGFDPLLLPDLQPGEREAHHTWQNPDFFRLVDGLIDGPRAPLYREYPFSLRPSTDNRPYFSQFMRWSKTERLRAGFGARAIPFFELGSLVIALTFAVLALLALGCIVLPLARLGWRRPGKAGVILYFGGLGAGFMCVEIGLMLRAQAWLGSPIAAAAMVITGLLVAAGAGSLWSERFAITARNRRRAVAIIAGGILFAALVFPLLDHAARGWPAGAQVALLFVLVTALGVALGMAFPLGLRWLEATAPAHVAWAWAINGCLSVATPAGAMLLALNAGFGAVLIAAAAFYALALAGVFLAGEKT